MTATATELRLVLAGTAENLALVRQALAGFADAVGIDDLTLGDLKQIATEACMNAVVHAYPDGEAGRVEVRAVAADGSVELRVRDWGAGFRPRPADADRLSLRLGLPLIASLSTRFEIISSSEGGTEIVAVVSTTGAEPEDPGAAVPAPDHSEVAVTAGSAARPVIARVIALAATRAGLSLDRMSDSVLLGDVISTHDAGDFPDRRLGVEVDDAVQGALVVRVGPFVDGGAQRLLDHMEVPGMGVSISKLADRVETEPGQDGDYVVIELGAESA